MIESIVFFVLLSALATSTTEADCAKKTNCLSCLEVENCFFCYKFEEQKNNNGPQCMLINATGCVDSDKKRSKRCVEELGGDAKDSVRYAIGFSILAASIVIDLAIRLCSRRKALKDEYSHL
ncbi:hypothetical protein M9Y10_045092 [Tritrichomonas musculus]|uniref:Uncharacterized protein n=1 Tax=Tritrichomonas musculus TaxID=1915356 RepID=A0ABR2JUA2_9EUKA